MGWLQRHSWWGLVAMSVLVGLFGLGDLLNGFEWEPSIPLGYVGMTPQELRAASPPAYRLLDHGVRSGGVDLLVIGALLTAILLFAFRRSQRWAWWAAWALPAWATAATLVNLAFGVAPGQAPPPPLTSGPVFAVLAAAILLVSAPRFFGRRPG